MTGEPPLLLRDVEVAGRRVDVSVAGGRVTGVWPTGSGAPADGTPGAAQVHAGPPAVVVDGAGAALLPGLHDHHLHLLALTAARRSVDCGPPAVRDPAALAAALGSAPGAAVRGVNYHESVAGPLDRHRLDGWEPRRPVRISHRSGALWMLNSVALQQVAASLGDAPGVERDAAGVPTGRLWRLDDRLRAALPGPSPPDLAGTGRRLAALGLTGVTDATPDLDAATIALLTRARVTGDLPQRLVLLGAPTEPAATTDAGHRGVEGGVREPAVGAGPAGPAESTFLAGPRKLVLPDHDLPDAAAVLARVRAARRQGRAVAVHCVTAEALTLALAALTELGPAGPDRPVDRIEHASVVPPGLDRWLAETGAAVVTQPGFLATRGDDYRRDVDPAEHEFLYRYGTLRALGVPVLPSSDAPYGPVDPWAVIAAATHRRTPAGAILGPTERVPAAVALAGYLTDPLDPRSRPRRVRPGGPADLILLDAPLTQVLADPSARRVRLTVIAGRIVHRAG